MAVKLRLRRMGKKKQPVYKVVAADSRSPRDGKFLEAIGLYNPKSNPALVDINEQRALYWLGVGAQPTETVRSLLSKQGILLKKELLKKKLSEEEIANKISDWQKLKEAKKSSVKKTEKLSKKAAAKKAAEANEQPGKAAEEVNSTAS